MRINKLLLGVIILVVALVLGAAETQAALINNGSFENLGHNDPKGFITLASGNITTGWTVGGNRIDYISTYWKAPNGTYSLDLNAVNLGSISQTFATTSGTMY